MAAISKIKVNGTAYDLQDPGAARTSHTHGSITSAGAITGTTALANGDGLIFADSSDSSKLKRSSITIGTGTTTFLRNDGTWAAPPSGGGLPGVNVTGTTGGRHYLYTDSGYSGEYESTISASIDSGNSWYDSDSDCYYSSLIIKSPSYQYDSSFTGEMGHSEISLWQRRVGGDPFYHGIAIESARGYGTDVAMLYIGRPIQQLRNNNPASIPLIEGWGIGGASYDGFVGVYGDAYSGRIVAPYVGTAWFVDIINHISGCIMEGTLITMADGSLKPVEDVNIGDKIRSYDFISGEYTTAVCLINGKAGESNKFNCNLFSNGKILYTHDVHRVVTESTRDPIPSMEKLNIGDSIYMEDLTKAAFEGAMPYQDNSHKRYYHIISSSGIYFTNGIMSANCPPEKVSEFKRRSMDVDDDLIDQWEIDSKYNQRNNIDNPEFLQEAHHLFGEIEALNRTINDAKANLISTDYVTLKHDEGLVDEDTWEATKALREEWRHIINISETPLAEKNQQLDILRKRYGVEKETTDSARQSFYDSVHANNALYEVYANFRKDEETRKRLASRAKLTKLEVTEDEKTEGTDS